MHRIFWQPKARKQAMKIKDRRAQIAVADAVDTLKNFPECRNVKTLTNHENGYRLRVGRYRVLFDVNQEIRIIDVQEVKERDDQTY